MRRTKNKKGSNKSLSQAAQFEKERVKILSRAVTLGAFLCAIIVPLFCLLDFVFKSHIFWTFFTIRLSVTLISIKIFFISKNSFGNRYPYLLAALLAITVCGSIALMCRLDMGPTDPYYAGINLPLLGFGILLPLTLSEGIIVVVLIWLSYFVPNILILKSHEVSMFVSNNFFLVSTIIISLVSSRFNFHYTEKQWLTQRKLRSANQKIKDHANELEKKVQERSQKLLQSERLAVVGQLAGGIAHDFNNILTAILGISELLLSSLPKKDAMRADIENISCLGSRATDLVKQLLTFSRRHIVMPQIINLNEIINHIHKMLARVIGENIELVVSTQSDLGYVQVDPVRIEQIILNLAVNARDAMPEGGKLIIETVNVFLDKTYIDNKQIPLPSGDYILLTVSDTGKGMSEEVKSKIFEPFFTTKEKGQGTGLGLSSVYGIVKQSNGDILVYSEEGTGTTFKIYLPSIKEPTEKPSKETKDSSRLPRGDETILLVEDAHEVRTLTARMLKKQGYKVMQASEGNEAISLSEKYKGQIDLLMTDVIMPHMNGNVLAERLIARRSDMKVLYLSGHTETMFIHKGILNPSTEFLQKPYTLQTLSYKIRTIFDN